TWSPAAGHGRDVSHQVRGCSVRWCPSSAAQGVLQLFLGHLRPTLDVAFLGVVVQLGLRRPPAGPVAATGAAPPALLGRLAAPGDVADLVCPTTPRPVLVHCSGSNLLCPSFTGTAVQLRGLDLLVLPVRLSAPVLLSWVALLLASGLAWHRSLLADRRC